MHLQACLCTTWVQSDSRRYKLDRPSFHRLLHSIHHGRCPDQAVVHHSAPSLPAGLGKPHAALEVCILAHLNVHELQCTCLELPA